MGKKFEVVKKVLPSIFGAPFKIREMMSSPRLKPGELRELQNKKLSAIVRHSYESVPYYHLLFKRARIKPDDIRTTEDLRKIPITEKDDLRHLPLEKVVARNANANRCVRRVTSGTTGTPLVLYWTVHAKLMEQVGVLRWKSECGVRPTDREVAIGVDYILNPLKKLVGLANLIRSQDDLGTQIKQIKRFKPSVLLAYPSCVRILAKEIRERNVQSIDLKSFFTTGEMLDNYTRELAKEVFGADVFDAYGSIEVGGVCSECVQHTGYHIWADSAIVQIIQNGEEVSIGEEGEITVTHLANYVMPFIRYNLKDLGFLMRDSPSCGSQFPLMRITLARKSEVVRLPGNILIPALVFRTPVVPVLGVKQFQVVQERADLFTIKVVKDSNFTDATPEEIRQKLLAQIEPRLRQKPVPIEIDILIVDNIPREKSGKFKEFVTKITPPSV